MVVVVQVYSEFSPSRSSQYLPYNYLDGEPGVTDTLNVEEGFVGVGAVLVQGPAGRHVGAALDGHVPDDWNSHVGVSLQAEGEDANADEEDGDDPDHLGGKGGVWLVEHEPDLGFGPLPPAHSTVVKIVLKPKPLGDLLIAGFLGVDVESVKDGEGLLGVPVLGVGHPAAWLHLVTVQAPVLQLLLEQRPAHVGRVVELPGPVVVEDLAEHSRVSVRWRY